MPDNQMSKLTDYQTRLAKKKVTGTFDKNDGKRVGLDYEVKGGVGVPLPVAAPQSFVHNDGPEDSRKMFDKD